MPPPLNYVLLDHPELKETENKMQSINYIYERQIMDGVAITDLTSLNTNNGSTGLIIDIVLGHAVQEKALGKLTASEKKKRGTALYRVGN
jgi:hypothetical protein